MTIRKILGRRGWLCEPRGPHARAGTSSTSLQLRCHAPPVLPRFPRRYPNGYEAVLEPRSLAAVPLTEMGYKRAPECAHVQRDIQRWQAERRAMEEAWERHEATLRLRTEALNLEGGGRKLKGSGPAGMSPAKRPVTAR